MILGLVVVAMLIMKLWPATPVARRLHRDLVETTCRFLARVTRRHLIFLILIVVAVTAGAEILAMAGPPHMAIIALWDVATFVDVVSAVLMVAAVGRARSAWFALRARISSLTRRPGAHRRPRAARRPSPRKESDDKGDRWVGRPAFA